MDKKYLEIPIASSFIRIFDAVSVPDLTVQRDIDALNDVRNLVKNDRLLSISIDFHTGVLMALDSAKQLGISTKLDVFDTKGRVSEISSIINDTTVGLYDKISIPIIISPGNIPLNIQLDKLDNIPFTITYNVTPDLVKTQKTKSYAYIILKNLKTYKKNFLLCVDQMLLKVKNIL